VSAVPVPTLANSVRFDGDVVEILDRRVFPFERRWVTCRTVEDVAVAIEQMVTQSSGPLFAATAGLVLAAHDAATTPDAASARARLHQAGARLVRTRPTNNHIRDGVAGVLAAVDTHPDADPARLVDVVTAAALAQETHYRRSSDELGRHAAALLPEGARVLTHCWADLYLVGLVSAALRDGKRLEFLCTETRPYLQGARLTAETLGEMGFTPTVLTDNMPAWAMQQGMVDAVVTAADRVTMDGHVVNKVGTLQIAVSAHAFGIPFHALVQSPDPQAPSISDVVIEQRDGDESLHALGMRTASTYAVGVYPAFDATPPRYVTDVATDRGVFAPDRLADYLTAPDPLQELT
jgi:methylthioribose-1-phosphate isomerase